MRDLIELVKKLMEGDVVSLQQHRTDKAFGDYADAMGGIIQGEQNFFKSGKFMPLAASYIKSGFVPEYKPGIYLWVHFRDPRPSQEARLVIDELRKNRFKYEPAMKWAKGSYKGNPDQHAYGPSMEKQIDLNSAKKFFAERGHSVFGAYQPSRMGMRTSTQNIWNDAGVGFSIYVMGYDDRRGSFREEAHVVDDEKDMKEVSDAFAAIERAKMKSV